MVKVTGRFTPRNDSGAHRTESCLGPKAVKSLLGPRTVQPVASRYTDTVIAVYKLSV